MTRAEAYADLFMLFCGKPPPIKLPEDIDNLCELDEAAYERLQDFVNMNLRLPWLTGIGVLEAMDALVYEAVANSELAFERAWPVLVATPRETKTARVCKRCGNAIRARGRDVQMCPLADGDICEPRRKK